MFDHCMASYWCYDRKMSAMTKTPLRVGVSLPFSVASSRLRVIPVLSVEVLCFVCIFGLS